MGEKKLQWINEQPSTFNILQFVKDIRESNESNFKETYHLTPGVASTLKKLPEEKIWELEEIALTETVTIKLNVGDEENPTFKEISELSRVKMYSDIKFITTQ